MTASARRAPRGVGWLALPAAALAAVAWPAGARAHEKWFFDAPAYPTDWASLIQLPWLIGAAAALVATLVAGLLWRARGRRDLIRGPEALGATAAGRARFYGLVPAILGIHVGVPLIVLGIRGELLAPSNALDGPALYWLGVAEIGIGVSLLYGGLTRLAGVALGAVWLAGIGVVGLEPMLESVHALSFAAFFAMTGRGPYAIDRLLFPRLEPSPRLAAHAMTAVRVTTGLGLAVVALTEKLANRPSPRPSSGSTR